MRAVASTPTGSPEGTRPSDALKGRARTTCISGDLAGARVVASGARGFASGASIASDRLTCPIDALLIGTAVRVFAAAGAGNALAAAILVAGSADALMGAIADLIAAAVGIGAAAGAGDALPIAILVA